MGLGSALRGLQTWQVGSAWRGGGGGAKVTNNFYMTNAEVVWAAGEVNNNMVVSEQSRIMKFNSQHNLKSLVQQYCTQGSLIHASSR